MGDRVRVGELLAAIGSIGLAVLLAVGAWFSVDGGQVESGGSSEPAFVGVYGAGTVGSSAIGWLGVALAAAGAAAGLWFIVRVVTAKTTERPLLQAPVAYALGVIALLTLILRVVVATPDFAFDPPAGTPAGVELPVIPMDVTAGGWLGLLSAFFIVIGTWIAMTDERTQSKGSRARTAALLANVVTRPAPPVLAGSHPGSDAGVVSDDAIPTDPPAPSADPTSTRPSGGPA